MHHDYLELQHKDPKDFKIAKNNYHKAIDY